MQPNGELSGRASRIEERELLRSAGEDAAIGDRAVKYAPARIAGRLVVNRHLAEVRRVAGFQTKRRSLVPFPERSAGIRLERPSQVLANVVLSAPGIARLQKLLVPGQARVIILHRRGGQVTVVREIPVLELSLDLRELLRADPLSAIGLCDRGLRKLRAWPTAEALLVPTCGHLVC